MAILEKLDQEIKSALKAQDSPRLSTVRMIKATVKNKEIELRHALSETEFIAVLTSMAKQYKDSIEQFTKAGRMDLVNKEQAGLLVIESYLPQPLSDAEVVQLIDEAVSHLQAKGPQDMGSVMKHLKDKTAGRIDGKKMSEAVRLKLNSLS